jgi:hypothetical protein
VIRGSGVDAVLGGDRPGREVVMSGRKTPFMKAIERILEKDPPFEAEVEKLIERMEVEQAIAARMEQLLKLDLG